MADIVTKIGYAMSLRNPQQEALSYLDAISITAIIRRTARQRLKL